MKNLKAKATLGLLAALGATLAHSTAYAAQRPITDFLSQQGTACMGVDSAGNLFCTAGPCQQQIPGIANYLSWTDPSDGTIVSFDYAGLANRVLGLGTTITGSINEVVHADGTVTDTILIRARNALTWANAGGTPGVGTVLFGQRPSAGPSVSQPALGSCTLKVVLNGTTANATLPDLIQLFFCGAPGWSAVSLSFYGQATGPLPDGGPGRLEVTEVGLLSVASVANPNSRVAFDAFPAEHIDIQATGQ